MFQRKLRAQLERSSRHVADAITASGREMSRELHQQAIQQSRQANSAEVANDLKLMEMGFSSERRHPEGVPLRCLWKLDIRTQLGGMEKWDYTEAVATYATVKYDEIVEVRSFEPGAHEQVQELIRFLRAVANPHSLRVEYFKRAHDMVTQYVLKGEVTGWWIDVKNRQFYSQRPPAWWRAEKKATKKGRR